MILYTGFGLLLLVLPRTNGFQSVILWLRLAAAAFFYFASLSIMRNYHSDGLLVGLCFFLLACSLTLRAFGLIVHRPR